MLPKVRWKEQFAKNMEVDSALNSLEVFSMLIELEFIHY